MVLFCKPRVCGEKKVWYGVEDIASGSPPRMRGKAQAEQVRRFLNGITPAYAGKRTKSSRCPPRMWDHPRVCGEKNLCILRRVEIPGSPPRMRGKATGSSCVKLNSQDHPRVCGEKPERKAPRRPRLGSPPRMRGKETDSRRQCCSAGITPAYAGKRTLFCLAGRRNRDHPRVCGEKSMYSGVFYERYRITPAYAGKSFPAGCPRSRSRDHPRVCGEKPRRPPAAAVGIGSPPRMRGKDSIMDGLQGVHGITPAYAGKRR